MTALSHNLSWSDHTVNTSHWVVPKKLSCMLYILLMLMGNWVEIIDVYTLVSVMILQRSLLESAYWRHYEKQDSIVQKHNVDSLTLKLMRDDEEWQGDKFKGFSWEISYSKIAKSLGIRYFLIISVQQNFKDWASKWKWKWAYHKSNPQAATTLCWMHIHMRGKSHIWYDSCHRKLRGPVNSQKLINSLYCKH